MRVITMKHLFLRIPPEMLSLLFSLLQFSLHNPSDWYMPPQLSKQNPTQDPAFIGTIGWPYDAAWKKP